VTLADRTREVLAQAREVYRGSAHERALAEAAERLDAPLRVAIAGRVKSGKSTLLNALVGEQLAPTDAGECTRILTWFTDGHTYSVMIHPRDGTPRQARFSRDAGALEIDLGGLTPEQVDQLVVTWPSQALRRATLIDTPGLGSLSEQLATRAQTWLAPADEDEAPADAVLYLMKHLHATDLEFLTAFHDADAAPPNPINAIGVLSRADEIGAGRPDAMASARRIATRLSAEPTVRRLVQTVVPVAGLLAETAATLTEEEVGRLRRISELAPREVEGLLLSVDHLVEAMPELGLTSIERRELLDRFGLFGIRLATTLLRRGVTETATELARELSERSGIDDLQGMLRSLFIERREVLKSRSALLGLDALLRNAPRRGGDPLVARVEEILSSAHPFNELRVLSSMRAGWVRGKPEVLARLEAIVGGGGAHTHLRLGLAEDAGTTERRAAAVRALADWQRRAENPLTDHHLAVAARVAVRSCEGILAEIDRAR
jgi:hypothetical protein